MAKKPFNVLMREARVRLSLKLSKKVNLQQMSEHLTERLNSDGGETVAINFKNLSKWELGRTKPDPEIESRIRKII